MITEYEQADKWIYERFDKELLEKKYYPSIDRELSEVETINIWKSETGNSGVLMDEKDVAQVIAQAVYEHHKNGCGPFGTILAYSKDFLKNFLNKK